MSRNIYLKASVLLLPILAVIYLWRTDDIALGQLEYQVNCVTQINWLHSKYAYWYIHLLSFLPVFALSFDRRVRFYTQWRYLFPAIIGVAVYFLIWDYFKTKLGVWAFNPN